MNIDLKCAQFGNKIAYEVKDETLITKSLGVLQEDGVYAFFLYLASKKGTAENIKDNAFNLLTQEGILNHVVGNEHDHLKAVRENFEDKLDELLLAKELLERTLVYARYHAKALGGE